MLSLSVYGLFDMPSSPSVVDASVVASVVAGVEVAVEFDNSRSPGATRSLSVRLLGPMAIYRDGVLVALPPSRKVRALIAYLALSPRSVGRSVLCELLWDAPGDPRAELRWCLSKIRSLVDDPGRPRVLTHDDAIGLDLSDCDVDAVEVARGTEHGVDRLAAQRMQALLALFVGDFLAGLELDDAPGFTSWLTAQRRRFRGRHLALLEQLVGNAPDDAALARLDDWLKLAPFDRRVHEILLGALVHRGRIQEGEEHLASSVASFESEGLDSTPIREAWRVARAVVPMSRHIRGGGAGPPQASQVPVVLGLARRAAIAVMPFVNVSAGRPLVEPNLSGDMGAALAHDVITRLAKLRTLSVIAQGTVFAMHERRIDRDAVGRTLDVDYLVGGTLRFLGGRLSVAVELAETRSARTLWAETFTHTLEDALLVLDDIGNRIVATVTSEIETVERNRAILKPPNSLDAWEAHHRGLWHMYRFDAHDNARARHFFDLAVRLDPTFSPAYAGLSFTHFQAAFQGWAAREFEIDRAFETAGQAIMIDDRDPAAHWAMGRALWLRGRAAESAVELERSVDLSPNFALGHYALAFVQSQTGDAASAILSSDRSRQLSPGDPLLFGMLASRAMALVRLGRFEEAADWAVRAAARPNPSLSLAPGTAC